MNQNQTKQYRAELTVAERATITINSADEDQIKELVTVNLRAVLGSNPTFADNRPDAAIFVFHPKIADGKQPCGWINQFTVPTVLGVKNLTESRMRQLQAA